jgi:hypothetical protein
MRANGYQLGGRWVLGGSVANARLPLAPFTGFVWLHACVVASDFANDFKDAKIASELNLFFEVVMQ